MLFTHFIDQATHPVERYIRDGGVSSYTHIFSISVVDGRKMPKLTSYKRDGGV